MRAYDPTLGRFLARDPLGRAPLFGPETQPYVYAGNNPLKNVDPSGQMFYMGDGGGAPVATPTSTPSGVQTTSGAGGSGDGSDTPKWDAQGRCANYAACDQQRARAAEDKQHERDGKLAISIILNLVLDAARLWLDSSDDVKEITDAINMVALIANAIGLVGSAFLAPMFGANSWIVGLTQQIAAGANRALGVLRAVQALVKVWWAGVLVKTAIFSAQTLAEGELAPILSAAKMLLGGAIIDGAATFIYVFAQQAQDAGLEADELGHETAPEYCANSGACSPGWNK